MGARDRRIATLAEQQYGVFSRRQVFALGVQAHIIRHRLDTGAWKLLYRGVYRLTGVPDSFESGVLAAVLAAGSGAFASHSTAAQLWRFEGVVSTRLDISVAARRRVRLPGMCVHRPAHIARNEVTRIGSIPVTAPGRTLIDLASAVDPDTLEEALDDVLRRRLVTRGKLVARLEGLTPNGRRGLPVLQRLLVERSGGISGSPLETRFRRLLLRAGLPEPQAQYEIRRPDGSLVARVDFAFPSARLAIEVDGYAFHSSRQRWEADRIRENRLADVGWQVLRVTNSAIRDPDEILGIVRRALAARFGVTG